MAKAKKKKAQTTGELYKCLRCKGIMEKTDAPSTNVLVHVPWFTSFIHARAYVCPKCGFVELCVE